MAFNPDLFEFNPDIIETVLGNQQVQVHPLNVQDGRSVFMAEYTDPFDQEVELVYLCLHDSNGNRLLTNEQERDWLRTLPIKEFNHLLELSLQVNDIDSSDSEGND